MAQLLGKRGRDAAMYARKWLKDALRVEKLAPPVRSKAGAVAAAELRAYAEALIQAGGALHALTRVGDTHAAVVYRHHGCVARLAVTHCACMFLRRLRCSFSLSHHDKTICFAPSQARWAAIRRRLHWGWRPPMLWVQSPMPGAPLRWAPRLAS